MDSVLSSLVLKIKLKNIVIALTSTLLSVLFTSCVLGKHLHKGDKVNEWSLDYHLAYNNRTKNHVPEIIYATIYKPNEKLHLVYFFHLQKDLVEKAAGFDKRRFPRYRLLVTSNTVEEITGINKLTSIDSAVFTKVTFLSDSLKTKNYSYLKNAIGFKLMSE